MKAKQLFLFIFALIAALMTSCTEQDPVQGTEADGTRTFNFNVTAGGGTQTRATTAAPVISGFDMQYILQVLDADGNTLDLGSGVTQQTNTTGAFAVKLPVGKVYTCLFWAQYVPTGTDTSDFFTTTDLQAVTLKKPLESGDESQAFTAVTEIPAAPTDANISVTMTRAVAQLNLKSNEKMENYSKVKASYTQVPDQFNVKTNEVTLSGANNTAAFEATTFAATADGAGKFPFHSAYVLASGNGNANLLKVQLEIFNTASTVTPIQTVNINDVPAKRNFRTNIVNSFDPATTKHTYAFDYEAWGGDENVAPLSLWDGTRPAANSSYKFRDGNGTEANPYIIGGAEDFVQLAVNVNDGTDYNLTYFLLNIDIDLNGENYTWTPIGTEANMFKGRLDGDRHRIVNMKIVSAEKYVGLFGYMGGYHYIDNPTGGGGISNLHVSGDITATYTTGSNDGGAGGICGGFQSYGDCRIANCSFNGKIVAKDYAGGIVGNQKGEIYCSKNLGAIYSETGSGGIAGYTEWNITACYNEGTITGKTIMGGIAGATGNLAALLSGCYNIGTVKAEEGVTTSAIGGIADNLSVSVANCFVKEILASNFGNSEKEFNGTDWPVSTGGTVWYADPSNDGSENKYWKSVGDWKGGSPVYPKLWWEE